ncbi:MAG: hypothetical protein IJS08_10060, partial [Victivallales bacterium]|nr:hypothetical protein [Victivallales bacterium]
ISEDVDNMMADHPELARMDAIKVVRNEWLNDDLKKPVYLKFQKAIPEIEKLSNDEQMHNTIKRLRKEAENYGKTKLVRKLNEINSSHSGNQPLNKWQIMQLSANVTVTSVPTIWGLGFLANEKWEDAKAWKEVEEALE